MHGTRGGVGVVTQQRAKRSFKHIVTASLLTLSDGDRNTAADLLGCLKDRNGVFARFDIPNNSATQPPTWLIALRQQYHLALDLQDRGHARAILSSIAHTNAAYGSADRFDDASLREVLSRRERVLEPGDEVVLQEMHNKRPRFTVKTVHPDGTMDLEAVPTPATAAAPTAHPAAPAAAPAAPAAQPTTAAQPGAVAHAGVARTRVKHADDIVVTQHQLKQAREHSLRNGPGQAAPDKPK
jgi:hypothetical protein